MEADARELALTLLRATSPEYQEYKRLRNYIKNKQKRKNLAQKQKRLDELETILTHQNLL